MDRNWVIINNKGGFVSQRDYPLMSQIRVELTDEDLKFSHKKMGEFCIKRKFRDNSKKLDSKKLNFKMWDNSCWGYEVEEASEWFSQLLGERCYLLSAEEEFFRQSSQNRNHHSPLVYADGYPLLAVSLASIRKLQETLAGGHGLWDQESLLRRFRPNIVLSGLLAHEEDSLGKFQLGDLVLEAVKDCPRCVIVNVDPDTGKLTPQVLKTLSSYRKNQEGIVFGQNLVCLKTGKLKVGDSLTTSDGLVCRR